MSDMFLDLGMERLAPSMFFRKYNFFRTTQLTKFNTFTSDMQLPIGSCLHLLDNLYHLERNEQTFDVPDINIPFINNETYRMFMYHVRSPMLGEDELIKFDKKYRYIPSGLLNSLRIFNKENLSRIKPLNTLKDIPQSKNTLTIVNHNPVFRARIPSSITPQYDKFRLILSSILNVMSRIEGKTQYVLFPLGDRVYSKSMFTQAAKEIKPTSIKVKNDYHYFLMMHWLNFLDTTSDQSLFLQYPKELWPTTNFIFYIGDKFMMYTLSDIVNLNADNKVYNRHVNQINSLVLKDIADKENSEEFTTKVENALIEYETNINEEIEENIVEKENEEIINEIDKNRVPDKADETNIDNNKKNIDGINKVVKNTQKTVNSHTTNNTIKDYDDLFNDILVSLDNNRKEIINNANTKSITTVKPIKDLKSVVKKNKENTINLTSNVNSEYTQDEDNSISDIKEIDISFDVEDKEEKSSKVSIKGFSTISEVSDNYEKFIEELDKKAEDFINNADLTPAQKKRYLKLATAYKKVTINNITLEDQIKASFDPNISTNSVNVGEGYLKDSSMANSSIIGYDDEYLNKLYFRHLAQVATSFNDKGMFLVNIEQEPVIDEFNRVMNYKFVFEDINGKRHTVKFSLPIVDRNGYCLVNGIKMYFKKQMVNLPICKVSDNRVSLASNYNKTIIERNTHKAHSFKPYFQRLINTINKKIKDVIKVDYNTKIYNNDLPYEYTEIMSLYKKIWFTYNNYDLNFTLSDIEEERLPSTIQPNILKVLKTFENKFGIYLGTLSISKDTNYCFVDKYNIIHIVDIKGVTYLKTSFIDLFSSVFKVSLNTLEEWTNIKIQDKLFPTIFLLCYKNGITKILRELDASYKLIARDKAVNRIEDLYQENFNKIKHLDSLNRLNLDDSEYVILGSASAMLYGYPHPNGNEDLDVIVSETVIERLIDNGYIRQKEKPGFSTPFYESLDGKVEISTYCDYLKADLEKVKEVSTLAFGYRFLTLSATLEFYKNGYKAFKKEKHLIKYQWLKSNSKVDPIKSIKKNARATDIIIPFKDKILVVPRYPLTNSLLLSGLLFFDTSRYNFEDFNLKDTYHLLLTDKGNGYRTNYLKGIDDHFNLFVDPMTRDILVQMNEPTEFGKLLIRATEMLTTIDYNEASAIANHRLRSYERFNAILYNKLARTYATYTKKSGAGNSFSIPPTEVIQAIISDPAMMNVEDINPIMDIKLKTSFTYGGSNGRTNESFVTNDRRFPKDGVGVISEANNDNKGVGYNAYLSMDPNLANVYGVLKTLDNPRDAEPTSALSVSGLTFPGATNDDPKRASFISIQLTHHMPVDTQKSFRIRTGYERIVAQRAGDLYAVSAKMDGEVIAIDEKAGLFKVRYVDGSMEVYTFGEEYGICADIVTTQKQELLVTVGQKFKKDEILCYNPQFFEKDPYSNQVDWKLGTPAKVALAEIAGTYEDSSTISKNFAEKISIQPVEIRDINLTTSNYIHKFAKLGDIVDINDPLLIFENDQVSDMSSFNTTDNEALDYLVKLNRKTPKAKFAGTIVNIEVFSGCPYEELNDSFKALYREANRKRARRAEFAKDTKDFMLYPPVKTIPEGSKFKGVMFNRETVMIRYYIQETVLADVGSKIVVDSSMKSIISDILENSVSTESGKEIDVIFSCSSISNRIVCSPLIEGITESVMESLEKEITNMGI